MKNHRVWYVLAPLVALWTLAFAISECGNQGTLDNRFLRTKIYPSLRRFEGQYTDFKFRTRGPRPVKNKIVIVEIDDLAVAQWGRWPWHRDAVAILIYSAFEAGAKTVGLDIVFPEPDVRVPEGVAELLTEKGLGDQIPTFETDNILLRIIGINRERLVLGWMSDGYCWPAHPDEAPCVVDDPEEMQYIPEGFDKFGYAHFEPGPAFTATRTPIASAPDVIANLPSYNEAAVHTGFLMGGTEEPDQVVRRASAVLFVNGKPYPSLPLEMARIGLEDELRLRLDGKGLVAGLDFVKTGKRLPVSPTGLMSINFRGAGYHFPYVGANDLLGEEPEITVQRDGKKQLLPREEVFKDAYVFIGVSAIGARDLRQFPFGQNVPGTEGLATVLDNVLTGDLMVPSRGLLGPGLLFVLMTLGALGFAYAMMKLEARYAVLAALGTIVVVILLDIFVAFARRDVNLNAGFLLAQLSSIFVVTVAMKYFIEERGKKLIRGTFSKYLAPAVVDEMLKDPENLKLGGEMRKLTIMMSDLRGFTAIAERLKPDQVLGLLNNYLGTMADIIIEYEGTIDEFIGDAILVIFGAPVSKPDDARRAVACCIAMQRAMKGINEHSAKLGLPAVEMGIALNTGEVIVGNIGSEKHVKYGVVGSHVNLTARIESNTVGGQVLISGTTLALAGDDIKLGEKQMIVAKGFPEPIAAYEIKGIGGSYNLFLDEVNLMLAPLAAPLAVSYRVMKSKNEEGPQLEGRFTSVSVMGAVFEAAEPLEAFKNLKMIVYRAPGERVEGDLYAKVTTSGSTCTLRFTAVPPVMEAFLKPLGAIEESERSSELAERD